jgi:hypothetical protein
MEFDHGRLATIESGGAFGVAGSDLFPRIQLWRWKHRGLASVADSGLRAQAGDAPSPSAPALPPSGCPEAGTYTASFGVVFNVHRRRVPNAPITVEVFPRQPGYPTKPGCTEYVSPLTPVNVNAGRTSSKLTSVHYTNITNRRWITAPAWLLISGNDGFGPPTPLFYRTSVTNPWYIPPSLGVDLLLTNTGDPKEPHFHRTCGAATQSPPTAQSPSRRTS